MVDEDLGVRDITVAFTPNRRVKAQIIAKEDCMVSGITILKILFNVFNIKVLKSVNEGSDVEKNAEVFLLEGDTHDILVIERTALNILSRMSGISSLTREFVKRAGNVRVAATRKTSPLFGFFEKEAVRLAGGDTHRIGLYDCVLIKDNHLKLFSNVAEAVEKARENTSFITKIEVEVSNKEDALEAAKARADIILLDNMSPDEIREAVSALSDYRDKIIIEASGNITVDNIEEYAASGVDVISVGALTHSATAKDFSLRIL